MIFIFNKPRFYVHDSAVGVRHNQLQLTSKGIVILTRSENESWQLGKELLAKDVDRIVQELIAEYNNPDFKAWYAGAVYDLGAARINELRNISKDGRDPARLFSFYVNQERQALKNKWKLSRMREQIGE